MDTLPFNPAVPDASAEFRESIRQSAQAGLMSQEAAERTTVEAHRASFMARTPAVVTDTAPAHLAEQTDPKMYPYKVHQKQAQKFRETCPADMAKFKARFELLCEEGDITPLTSLVCYYLLYAHDLNIGAKHLLHPLLYADVGKRTSLFNWEVLETIDTATQSPYGPYIEEPPVPLIPGGAGEVKNGTIIRKFRESLKAGLQGGATDDFTTGIYRRPREGLVGGGYMEFVVGAKGEQAASINMEGTESRLIAIYNAMQGIQQEQNRIQQPLASRGPAAHQGQNSGAPRGNGQASPGRGRGARANTPTGKTNAAGGWTRYGGDTDDTSLPQQESQKNKSACPVSKTHTPTPALQLPKGERWEGVTWR